MKICPTCKKTHIDSYTFCVFCPDARLVEKEPDLSSYTPKEKVLTEIYLLISIIFFLLGTMSTDILLDICLAISFLSLSEITFIYIFRDFIKDEQKTPHDLMTIGTVKLIAFGITTILIGLGIVLLIFVLGLFNMLYQFALFIYPMISPGIRPLLILIIFLGVFIVINKYTVKYLYDKNDK